MPSGEVQPRLDSARVLTRATLRAADKLGLSQRDLAKLLGVSPASMSRLTRGRSIDPSGKEGELALLFLRLFRSLDALVGGDEAAAHAWFHARNLHLDAVPADLVVRVDGLVHVVEYLDAMRGRL
jgi:transcriptional regulator with XRE-family HTH domain